MMPQIKFKNANFPTNLDFVTFDMQNELKLLVDSLYRMDKEILLTEQISLNMSKCNAFNCLKVDHKSVLALYCVYLFFCQEKNVLLHILLKAMQSYVFASSRQVLEKKPAKFD